MAIPILGKISILAQALPWPWRIGLGVPLLLGTVLALLAAISWFTGSGYKPPEQIDAGRAPDFAIGSRTYFKEERVWLVRLTDGQFLALYDRDTESGCAVSFRAEYKFMGRTGWFRDACHGSVYDLTGRCFDGPCQRGLDRFTVDVRGDNVVVKLRELLAGPPRDPTAEPVNPP